jgi:hypothetical protein
MLTRPNQTSEIGRTCKFVIVRRDQSGPGLALTRKGACAYVKRGQPPSRKATASRGGYRSEK